jgi:hypothetical protein
MFDRITQVTLLMGLLGSPGLASHGGAGDPGAYLESGGLVAIELEDSAASGFWQRNDALAGSTGAGYLTWNGTAASTQEGLGTYAIEVMIERVGRYQLRLRSHHDQGSGEFSWVRIDGGAWKRLRSTVADQWTWSTLVELAGGGTPNAAVALGPGRHLIEISAGSLGLRQDRLHLYLPSLVDGENNSLPLSAREYQNEPPLPRFSITPNSLDASDNGATVVTLDGSASLDPDAGQTLSFNWQLRGAQFVEGTSASSPIAKVRLMRTGIARGVRLEVRDDHPTQALVRSGHGVIGVANAQAEAKGRGAAWQPFELWFHGPTTHEDAPSPNPFLDYRLDVTFTSSTGVFQTVPGFYAGDGLGGGAGDVWKVRFTAPQGDLWSWTASFRQGSGVAVASDPNSGSATHFDGATGSVFLLSGDPQADGFWAKGPLRYVGEHYLRFENGEYFLKGGTDSPENLLGYDGFDDVQDQGGVGVVHRYLAHEKDWREGDPLFFSSHSGSSSKGLIGGLNYLASAGVNSVYFLPMNLGGDGRETYPFIDPSPTPHNRTHYDISRLHQWNQVLDHAQRRGIMLHIVLAESEQANENWFDGGAFGSERKLFFRELIARFGHAAAIKWNLSEENDFSIPFLEACAARIASLDSYGHALAVHTWANNFSDYPALLGKPNFTSTSIQYAPHLGGAYVEEWRERSSAAGHPWVLDMDENTPSGEGLSDSNADYLRKVDLYDVYFSGGQIEWYGGYHNLPLGGDVKMEDFRTRAHMWRYMRIAREFMEDNLPFWEMEPRDDLLTLEAQTLGGAEVFAKAGEVYAVYLPGATSTGELNLAGEPGRFQGRWFDPRVGRFIGVTRIFSGGAAVPLGAPPRFPDQDWIYLVQRQ